MDRKLNRFVKIYPWFHGLTADLLFYIAIDTLFLTAVKELSAAQRAFFALVYRLLVGRETGPRVPTLLLAVGAEQTRALLTA